jgi:hypothetical protein
VKLDRAGILGAVLGFGIMGSYIAFNYSPMGRDSARRSISRRCTAYLVELNERKQKIVNALQLQPGMPFPGDALVKIYDDPSQPEDGDTDNEGRCTYHFNAVGQNPTCDYIDNKYPHRLP